MQTVTNNSAVPMKLILYELQLHHNHQRINLLLHVFTFVNRTVFVLVKVNCLMHRSRHTRSSSCHRVFNTNLSIFYISIPVSFFLISYTRFEYFYIFSFLYKLSLVFIALQLRSVWVRLILLHQLRLGF